MGKNPKMSGFSEEYQEFLTILPVEPPSTLSDRIKLMIQEKLNPPLWLVLGKVAGIYTATGALVLMVCPQFGLTLAAEQGVLRWFGMFGAYPCMALCGALFLGSGTVVASFILLPEELRKLKPLRFLYFAAFGLLALAIFWILGAEIALGLGLAWLVGSIGGEAIAFELGWWWRFDHNLKGTR